MDHKIDFEYLENISSTDKNLQPQISIGSTAKQEIANYFYHLNNEDIIELDKIYDFSKKIIKEKKYVGTINKQTWFAYMNANNIEIKPLSEGIKKGPIKVNEDNSISVNIRNGKKVNTLTFKNIDLYNSTPRIKLKRLFATTITSNNTLSENNLYLSKKGTFDNDRELLYIILNCLFNANNDFYIKKCSLCGKYYLTTKVNKLLCYRKRIVCGIESTCCDASTTFAQSKQYQKLRRRVNNFLSKYRKKNDNDSIIFIGEFQEIVEDEILNDCKQKLDITEEDMEKLENLISNYKN